MATDKNVFRPDYILSPGVLLDEQLQTLGISARELARRCGRSPKLITEILSGKAALEPKTALQFERVLYIDATIWTNMEAEYRLHLARASDETRLADEMAWAKNFPLAELQKRGLFSKPKDKADAVRKLLGFFGVANVEACEEYFSSLAVAYRHSPSFDTNKNALFAWLRAGELEAEQLRCQDYDRTAFLRALNEIRTLTIRPIEEFLPLIAEKCAVAGVAFVVMRPFSGIALSGVSRWLNPRRPLVQQTVRHMSDDHFWFTFFHEAAHILHHSRKAVYVDGRKKDAVTTKEEEEANKWAAEFLVDPNAFKEFVDDGSFSEYSVRQFSEEQGVAPGIVVGQLQQSGNILFSHLNHLKVRFSWQDE